MKPHVAILILSVACTGTDAFTQASLTEGLVAYYPLDGNAADLSGNRYDGVVNNAVPTADRFGNANGALLFGGTADSKVLIDHLDAFSFEGDFTVSAWINFSGGTQGPRVFSTSGYEITTSGPAAQRNIFFNNYFGTSLAFAMSSRAFPEGSWLQVVGRRQGNTLAVFVNGNKEGETVTELRSDYSRGFTPTIGRNSGAPFDAFGGAIDELRIYDRALSDTEILLLTNRVTAIVENFDEAMISPLLVVPEGYVFGPQAVPPGSAQFTAVTRLREFINTVVTDFNAVDFILEVTVTTLPGGNGAVEAAFIGLGGTVDTDPNAFPEPHASIFLRMFGTDPEWRGIVDLAVYPDLNPASRMNTQISSAPDSGDGTHRVQLLKRGDVLTFNIDVHYDGGQFVTDFTISRSMSVDLPFLNNSNSRLFFGTQGSRTTFDDLRLELCPHAPAVPPLRIKIAEVALCWWSVTGVTYQVQYRSDATAHDWVPLGDPVVGDGSTNCVLDAVTQPKRFYRLIQLP